jgi:ribosomal protein L32
LRQIIPLPKVKVSRRKKNEKKTGFYLESHTAPMCSDIP